MGNKVVTTVLCCHPVDDVDLDLDLDLEFEEVQDAAFDFISVVQVPLSVQQEHANKSTSNVAAKSVQVPVVAPMGPSYFAANKVVAVVPVDQRLTTACGAPKPSSHREVNPEEDDDDEEEEVSFNERLNMLKWDPEVFDKPATKCHEEMYLFDEYAPPKNELIDRLAGEASLEMANSTKKPRTKANWLARLVGNCKKSSKSAREPDQQHPPSACVKKEEEEDECCVPLHDDQDEFSETESESDASSNESEGVVFTFDDQSPPCHADSPVPAKDPTTNTSSSYNLVKKTSSLASSVSCCSSYFLDEDDDEEFLYAAAEESSKGNLITLSASQSRESMESSSSSSSSSSAAPTRAMRLSDYLCACGKCPFAQEIYKEVTNSSCWMNEQERQSLCRLLLACATYNEHNGFRKEMIANAEECLLVFHGNEDDAFNALVLLNQAQYGQSASAP